MPFCGVTHAVSPRPDVLQSAMLPLAGMKQFSFARNRRDTAMLSGQFASSSLGVIRWKVSKSLDDISWCSNSMNCMFPYYGVGPISADFSPVLLPSPSGKRVESGSEPRSRVGVGSEDNVVPLAHADGHGVRVVGRDGHEVGCNDLQAVAVDADLEIVIGGGVDES